MGKEFEGAFENTQWTNVNNTLQFAPSHVCSDNTCFSFVHSLVCSYIYAFFKVIHHSESNVFYSLKIKVKLEFEVEELVECFVIDYSTALCGYISSTKVE